MRIKTEERRQAIITSAKEMFREHGFEATSMDMIAKHCGGSKATLYNYFKSKEAIFLAVIEHTTKIDFEPAFLKLEQNSAQPLHKLLCQFGQHYLSVILTPRMTSVRRMVYAESTRSNIGLQFYQNGPEKGLKRLAQFFDHQIELGKLQSHNTQVAALQFKALLHAELLEPYQLGCINSIEEQNITAAVERAVTGFLAIYQPQHKLPVSS
ncbi:MULTISPECIES: TetR/AcrR family transcriptional regulator [unclassified Vibrio]|uniref:TetR/AcrR family transcriptional regulator n=1 Tax=Vibrio sp. HB236076 TaxID=3232307 RepID=A0AB39HID0_9VIBR|nr:TetR/AcrR family transcriptional regulator [Vibrio sp. HB161653]MDP5255073.1 TetR/AcrR family transcriptional regulator [Vibrio sp. HB161653]